MPTPVTLEQRVEQEVDVVAAPRQRRAHAVDEERRVVADHLDRRCAASPSRRRHGSGCRPSRCGRPGCGRARGAATGDGAGRIGGGQDVAVVGLARRRGSRRRVLEPSSCCTPTRLGSVQQVVRHSRPGRAACSRPRPPRPRAAPHGRRRPHPRDHGVHALPPRGADALLRVVHGVPGRAAGEVRPGRPRHRGRRVRAEDERHPERGRRSKDD